MYFGFKEMTIKYGKREILKDITVEIPKGEITTIIGANGCGKSSLLKTIPRVVTPEKGSVIFKDKSILEYNPKELAKAVAYLPQIHTSPPDISVETLVSYGRFPHKEFMKGLSEYDKEVIRNTLKLTDMEDLKHRPLNHLSGGEKQRAWIAMTICQQPEILILDEPITYLDIGYQLEVMELIKYLRENLNITILMVLHDINLAARYSHRIVTLYKGGILSNDTPRLAITDENLKTVYDIDSRILEDEINHCPLIIPEKFNLQK